MLKKNKTILIVTTIVMFLPIIVGLAMWNILPDEIVTHWGVNGAPDSWSSKTFAIFGIPLFMLVIHWICVLVTAFFANCENVGKKAIHLVFWICPVMSIVCMSMVYAEALGIGISVEIFMPLFIGILFIIVGNYMPKCKRNYVIGVKLPWTVKSDENWYKTHRLAGIIWVTGGFITIITALFRMPLIAFILIILMIIIPMIYSFAYYLKNEKE